ncbi:hypothetical protein R3P38DRAFT_3362753 [Favolaschia claudopus]|uniref:Uncharacterized protein n=1 Tax=Favolaschia claudopus TaxID=2862362 RepID=A0AAW0AKZ0_9AGAR
MWRLATRLVRAEWCLLSFRDKEEASSMPAGARRQFAKFPSLWLDAHQLQPPWQWLPDVVVESKRTVMIKKTQNLRNLSVHEFGISPADERLQSAYLFSSTCPGLPVQSDVSNGHPLNQAREMSDPGIVVHPNLTNEAVEFWGFKYREAKQENETLQTRIVENDKYLQEVIASSRNEMKIMHQKLDAYHAENANLLSEIGRLGAERVALHTQLPLSYSQALSLAPEADRQRRAAIVDLFKAQPIVDYLLNETPPDLSFLSARDLASTLRRRRFDSSAFTLLTVDLLHGEDAIEQDLGDAACPRSCSCMSMDGNQHPAQILKGMQRVVERDNDLMPPICQPTRLEPPDAAEMAFINLKAPLVLHILDRKLGKSGMSLGLSRVLPKIFLSALTGDNNTISTHMFLRTCRKVSGVDPRTFAEQWIYGCGCPVFEFSASFNRKKMAVEITLRQECPAYKMLEGNDHAMALQKPVRLFEGQMTVRIHEADGTPYEHVLGIQSPFKYEVPFNTKRKLVGGTRSGMVDMGFGLEVWEKESERNKWKVEDWTEEDETAMSGATYEWIRMDADFEWVAEVKFEQPDFMWVSQLQRDRDVVAQLEALHALAQQPTKIVSSTLTKTVSVSNYYFRIHCSESIPRLDYLGLFHL